MSNIVIPDFNYASHYYAEILEDLITSFRADCPELSDEDPTESHIQILRAIARSGHFNNVLLDMVANEMFLPTTKLRSSTRNLLALIGVRLGQTSPASADVIAQLTQTFPGAVSLVPLGSVFSTLETPAAQAVEFECLSAIGITTRTDKVGAVYSNAGAGWADRTAGAQNGAPTLLADWGPAAGNALYIGHQDVMFNRVDVGISAGGLNAAIVVWEYYDSDLDQAYPTLVTPASDHITFDVTSLLGATNRAGAVVRVRSNKTGAYADLTSTWVGGKNVVNTVAGANAFLGQVGGVSTTPADYVIGTSWRELPSVVDGTAGLAASGAVTFTLPQTVYRRWSRVTVGGAVAASAYWVRARIVTPGGPGTSVTLGEVQITGDKQYIMFTVVQGKSREDSPLGSSDGSASQKFVLANSPVIDDSTLRVFVTEGGVEYEYSRVYDFLSSGSLDKHFCVEFDDDGIATVSFGDGTNGKIPSPAVDNIRAQYRTIDDQNGNVGSDTINVNRSGVAYLTDLANPRPASGYSPQEGSTKEDLVRLKVVGPAHLRVRERAACPEDVEQMTLSFKAADGSRPVIRSLGVEEMYGPKTIGCVVVGQGGTQVPASMLSELDVYFNGNATQRGKVVMNHRVVPCNFSPRAINITATLYGGDLDAVKTALAVLLNPLSVEKDGTWTWNFSGLVAMARIVREVMSTSPRPTNFIMAAPSPDVALGLSELPVCGVLNIIEG